MTSPSRTTQPDRRRSARPRRSRVPNVTTGVVVERASGQHEMSLVAPFISTLGSASVVTAEVPPRIGQAFLAAARGGSADTPAPIRQDQMPSEETLGHISQMLPRMLPSRDGVLDDPAVAAAVLVLVRTTSGRWLGSPAGDPAIISHGVTSVSSRTNALRWTADATSRGVRRRRQSGAGPQPRIGASSSTQSNLGYLTCMICD